MSDNSSYKDKIKDFVTFPLEFETYKWYKPIATFVIALVLYFVFSMVLLLLLGIFDHANAASIFNALSSSKYDTMDVQSTPFMLLSVAVIIPAIFIAMKIVRNRPIKSILTSKPDWNWSLFIKVFGIAGIIMLIQVIIGFIMEPTPIKNTMTIVSVILFLILIPVQCFAEELFFRGFCLQTWGSWFKIPVVAVIIQAIIFMLLHGYNSIGQVTILISGVCMGLVAWRTNGLEASTAMHSVNNYIAFFMSALVSQISSEVTLMGAVVDIIPTILITVIVLVLNEKYDFFNAKKVSD